MQQRVEWLSRDKGKTLFMRAAMMSLWISRWFWLRCLWLMLVFGVSAYVVMAVFHSQWTVVGIVVLWMALCIAQIIAWRKGAIKKYEEVSAKWPVSHHWIDDQGIGTIEGGSCDWSNVDRVVETREFIFVRIVEMRKVMFLSRRLPMPRKIMLIVKRDIGEKERQVYALLAAVHVKRARLI